MFCLLLARSVDSVEYAVITEHDDELREKRFVVWLKVTFFLTNMHRNQDSPPCILAFEGCT